MDLYHQILKQYWGYDSFRPLQEDIIHSIANGNDTLGLMPTGGGKSITFQVPALATKGICIVVTPLIALMKDQVDNLHRLGIKATAVYSGMKRQEIIKQLENCIFGDYKFLYVSPERLSTELFLTKLKEMQVNYLVIDESHCISQWGYDFRPSYLSIANIRELLPNIPVLALTATATPEVVDDIQEKLHFKAKNVFKKSFSRTNLSYIVRKTDDKIKMLKHILSKVPGTAIVYVRNRKKTKEIATILQDAGFSANYFHAGLNREEKNKRQNQWKNDECRIIVSTNAFGMGIDKPNVRIVVHMDMPGSLEEYYQEAGRAGRDGKRAYAVALYSGIDKASLKKRITDEYPEKEFIKRVYDALGNFFQIAVGYGANAVHDFSLGVFCQAYKLPMLQTHNALKLLELSGYIEYTEEIENASRIIFTSTREELYQSGYENILTDNILQTILRSYTGLFADYTYINEAEIASKLNISTNDVYQRLVSLSKIHTISYIPQKKTPFIIFKQSREEIQHLVIPKSAYEDRKERATKRIEKVIEYLDEQHICRSKMLVHYFGETEGNRCGSCDICLSKNEAGLTSKEIEQIKETLLFNLNGKDLSIKEVINRLPLTEERNFTAIRWLLDNSNLFELNGEYICLKQKTS